MTNRHLAAHALTDSHGRRAALLLAVALLPSPTDAQATDPGLTDGGPGFRDMLSLISVSGPAISPDGASVAYVRSVPDWTENRSVRELWIAEPGAEPRRLANEADGFRGGAQWTPDGQWLAFRQGGGGDPSLILLSPDGDRRTVPLRVQGAGRFRFSPDGRTLAVVATNPATDRARAEQSLYGPFEFRDEGYRMSHVWLVPAEGGGQPRRLTGGDFTVSELAWSPDGREIAFVHRPDPGRNTSWNADISVVDVETGTLRLLVSQAGSDRRPLWSPDGQRVAFVSTLGDSITNLPEELALVGRAGGLIEVLAVDFPTAPNPVAWTDRGIWFTALQRVENHLFTVDPDDGTVSRVSESPYLMGQTSVAADGSAIAFVATTPAKLGEVYRLPLSGSEPVSLTDMSAQVQGWDLGTREVVGWTGPGGVAIEGILHKPTDFVAGRSYPLLVVVHGGPRAVSTPALQLTRGAYPVNHFLRKGALVLQPNYRGSTGYGGEFRRMHGRALGWGDAGDVEAGVAYLIAEGLVDPERVGVMGWSYGGFISAYLTAQSKTFKAVSVGAGISDWRTHYAWEPGSFTTRMYSFDATPWEDPQAYEVASPITYINNASTPTLIQHVDGDPVVTVLNAYELHHALLDRGIETRFAIYPGSSHGIGPMRQRLGALWHNWQWFLRHIWGEEVELPTEETVSDGG